MFRWAGGRKQCYGADTIKEEPPVAGGSSGLRGDSASAQFSSKRASNRQPLKAVPGGVKLVSYFFFFLAAFFFFIDLFIFGLDLVVRRLRTLRLTGIDTSFVSRC